MNTKEKNYLAGIGVGGYKCPCCGPSKSRRNHAKDKRRLNKLVRVRSKALYRCELDA